MVHRVHTDFLFFDNSMLSRVLDFFIINTGEYFTQTDLRKYIIGNKKNLRPILKKLENFDFLHVKKDGGTKYYALNFKNHNKPLNTFLTFHKAFCEKINYLKKKNSDILNRMSDSKK